MSNFQLPVVDFYVLPEEGNDLEIKTSKDVFLGKRTVMFMLPGAFTPTCSEQQLPGFEACHDQILDLGVDQVVCVSVNDAFVMRAWGRSLGVTKTILLPDGNGSFTEGLKALVSKGNKGFGMRAWRLAMIINESGVVEWAGVEEGQRANASDDPYEESTPERTIGALIQLQANNIASSEADANIAHSFEELAKQV